MCSRRPSSKRQLRLPENVQWVGAGLLPVLNQRGIRRCNQPERMGGSVYGRSISRPTPTGTGGAPVQVDIIVTSPDADIAVRSILHPALIWSANDPPVACSLCTKCWI